MNVSYDYDYDYDYDTFLKKLRNVKATVLVDAIEDYFGDIVLNDDFYDYLVEGNIIQENICNEDDE